MNFLFYHRSLSQPLNLWGENKKKPKSKLINTIARWVYFQAVNSIWTNDRHSCLNRKKSKQNKIKQQLVRIHIQNLFPLLYFMATAICFSNNTKKRRTKTDRWKERMRAHRGSERVCSLFAIQIKWDVSTYSHHFGVFGQCI